MHWPGLALWALGAGAAVSAALAALLYTPDRPAAALAARYLTAQDRFVELLGARLRLRASGDPAAPALLLLHGFGASLETWEGWAAPLAEQCYVLRIDLPGFGLTGPDPTGDYSDARGVALLAALLDRLGLARANLAGNSLGGRLAWAFAAAHPARVERLILISPDGFASPGFAYGVPPKLPAVLRLLPYTLPKRMLRANLTVAYADPKRLTGKMLTRYHDLLLAPGNRRAMLARMGQVILQPPEAALRRIAAPTLILWGRRDRMIPFANAAEYLREIPAARLVELPELGHVPFEEAPAVCLGPVLEFLAPPAPPR